MIDKNIKAKNIEKKPEANLVYLSSPDRLLWLAKQRELRRRHLYCTFNSGDFPMQLWQILQHLEVLSISFSDGHTWYPSRSASFF
jgi:hypothetical protein